MEFNEDNFRLDGEGDDDSEIIHAGRYRISFPNGRCLVDFSVTLLDEYIDDEEYPNLWEEYRLNIFKNLVLMLEEFMSGYIDEISLHIKSLKTPSCMITNKDFEVKTLFGEFEVEGEDVDE